ncbi:protein-tyrosine phosphatase-like protein [Blyttiomyces helicus]|uniref:Protein-tyrosine phosphatase-like protein n=1 Tax=Blyttiomyces helicus TaxID=388810 RepID=A0A4V1IQ38_9FUNG|nr:protein-tyrosine phosphatase-like protein [Blyttiomyces helicus]|eukprot:RKO85207.1 protein-tyrosine phosphatase-like protein [Blyttiomyces helicus]
MTTSHPEIIKNGNPDLTSSSILRVAAPVFGDEDYSPEALAKRWKLYTGDAEGFAEAYMAILAAGGPAFSAIVRSLAADGPAVVVHCTAGKDRTGVIVALLLKLCGVDDDLVVRDYAVTETLLNYTDEHLAALAAATRGAITLPMARAMMSSKPEAMTAFLRKLVETYGSAAGYFRQCGVTAKELDAARAALVDPAPEDGARGRGRRRVFLHEFDASLHPVLVELLLQRLLVLKEALLSLKLAVQPIRLPLLERNLRLGHRRPSRVFWAFLLDPLRLPLQPPSRSLAIDARSPGLAL